MGLIHRPMERDRSCPLARFLAGCNSERHKSYMVSLGRQNKKQKASEIVNVWAESAESPNHAWWLPVLPSISLSFSLSLSLSRSLFLSLSLSLSLPACRCPVSGPSRTDAGPPLPLYWCCCVCRSPPPAGLPAPASRCGLGPRYGPVPSPVRTAAGDLIVSLSNALRPGPPTYPRTPRGRVGCALFPRYEAA